jgi:hypothetical protein
LVDQDDSAREPGRRNRVGRTDDLSELVQQSRERVRDVERLRAEQRLILAQTDRRLCESRRLLERGQERRADSAVPHLRQV